MNFKRLADQAKKMIDKRGGSEALKGDASELRDIAKGKGSLSDKAKAAAAALKEPGKAEAEAEAAAEAEAGDPNPIAPPASPPPAG
jgi:hypothetical protein